jgi:cell division protein FtsL
MTSKFLLTWKVAIAACTLAFLVHVTLCIEIIQLGYKLDDALRRERDLREQLTLLTLEAATLRQPKRLETVARAALGLEVPPPERVIMVGARNAGRSR